MNILIKYLSIFLISLFALLLEFLQIRIFSFQYWYHLVYFIVTTALLGIAIGGTVISLSQKLKTMAEDKFYAFCFLGFAVSVSLSTFIISFLHGDFFSFWQNANNILFLAIAYVLAAIPYIFFGLAMAKAWLDSPGNAAKIYFFNLTGSAIGILIFTVLLQPLGAERLIQEIVIMSWLAALIFAAGRIRNFKRITIFFTLCLLLITLICVFSLTIKPDKNKLYWTWFDSLGQIIFSEWNPVARIDVIKDPATGELAILNDGDAQTSLGLGGGHRIAVYVARGIDQPIKSVLVLGSGGGADVRLAYGYGSRDIDAVEINPTTVRLVKNEFSPAIDNVFKQEGVHLFEKEGRSFIKKTDKKYDVIMLAAVDSFSALNAGAYVMAENYPYTLEAFEDYWDHLDDNGFIQISRFYYPQAPRETLRVFTTFFEALSKKGIEEPEKHIIVLVDTEKTVNPFGSVIVSKKPIDASLIARFDEWLDTGFLFPKLSPGVGQAGHDIFMAFVDGWKKDKGVSFYKNYFFDVRPATDDKPFFYQYGKLTNILRPTNMPNDVKYYNNIRGQWPFLIVFSLLIQSSLIVFCLIFFPLRKLKEKFKKPKDWLYPLAYFGAIGAGFMFLELALIQKMVLFLGHPTYSLVVVIPALFFGLAIGSLFSSRISFKQQRLMMIPLILIILALAFSFSGGYLDFLLSQSLKIVLLITFIGTALLGFFAGIPFPSGINRLSKTEHFIPIAWAANGGFSVIGSIGAIILAMFFGFNLVVILSSILYFLAFILITLWDKIQA